jgi:SAM-dependent methyltransferase
VGLCAGLSLHAVQASAINLPFRNRSFDAGWTISTLMHLPGNDINLALTELGRVIRPGGLLEVGVWGADELHTRIDDHGRYFRLRTDDQLQGLLSGIGQVVAFETWDRFQTPAVTTNGLGYRWVMRRNSRPTGTPAPEGPEGRSLGERFPQIGPAHTYGDESVE